MNKSQNKHKSTSEMGTFFKKSEFFFFFFLFLNALSAQVQVRGKVSDSKGESLVGVNVYVEKTGRGTISDVNGNFSILVPNLHSKLKFSYVGMADLEIALDGKNLIDVVMHENVNILEEVVAIGYGNVKKSDLTGSVTSIKSDELLKSNPLGINQALQGKVSGVQVFQSDGAPGAGINIQIRGANSFTTNTEPLYVIDGIPFNSAPNFSYDSANKQTTNPLNLINPKDISSIEILKDASATAIYGSRGANGVILITTKKGMAGKTNVEFSSNINLSTVLNNIEVLDAATYAEYRNEQTINGYTYDGQPFIKDSNLPFPGIGYWQYVMSPDPITEIEQKIDSTYLPSAQDFRDGYMNGGTDWLKQIFRNSLSQEYNLTISGGDSKGTYLFSGSYLDQQGIIYNSYYKRYNIRSNITRKAFAWLDVGNSVNFTKSDNRFARTNLDLNGIIPSAMGFNPTRSIFDPNKDSGFSEDLASGLSNPYLYTRSAKNVIETYNIMASTHAEITFNKHLKFRQNLGYGYNYNLKNEYYNRWVDLGLAPNNGYGVQADNAYESFTSESMFMYYASLSEYHKLGALVAYTYEHAGWKEKVMKGRNFPTDITEEYNMSAALIQEKNDTQKGQSALMSYLARLNYTLYDRYLLTASYRRDGSSRLSPAKRWNDFFSGAFAWRLSDEQFIKKLGIFDNLKLRFSIGQTGNQGVAAYATRSKLITKDKEYTYNGNSVTGFAEEYWDGPANPNLKWETTTQSNIGVDMGFLQNKISLTLDLYKKDTKDLLQYMIIPNGTGFKGVYTNYGNVENKGIELTGTFWAISRNDLSWKIDANISLNRNKISGLNGDQFANAAWGLESMFIRRNGQPIGLLWGYEEDGYYDNEAEVRADKNYVNESDQKIRSMIGQVKYKDINNDKIIDDRDRTIIGNTNPDFIYGITNTINWKNWMLSFFFQGSQGNDILNVNLKKYDLSGIDNMPRFIYEKRWTEENKEDAQAPRPDITYSRYMKPSNRYVEDGSYLRLKNLTLTYTFIKPLKGIEDLKLTASVNNLFTITKYSWYDPDVNSFGNDASRRGVDMASYPNARVYNLGIQIVL